MAIPGREKPQKLHWADLWWHAHSRLRGPFGELLAQCAHGDVPGVLPPENPGAKKVGTGAGCRKKTRWAGGRVPTGPLEQTFHENWCKMTLASGVLGSSFFPPPALFSTEPPPRQEERQRGACTPKPCGQSPSAGQQRTRPRLSHMAFHGMHGTRKWWFVGWDVQGGTFPYKSKSEPQKTTKGLHANDESWLLLTPPV